MFKNLALLTTQINEKQAILALQFNYDYDEAERALLEFIKLVGQAKEQAKILIESQKEAAESMQAQKSQEIMEESQKE